MTNAKLSGEIRVAADGLQFLPTFKKLWNSWAVHAQRLETFIQTLEGEQEQLKAQLEQAGVGPLAIRVEELERTRRAIETAHSYDIRNSLGATVGTVAVQGAEDRVVLVVRLCGGYELFEYREEPGGYTTKIRKALKVTQ